MTDVAKLEYLQTISNVSTLANVIVTAGVGVEGTGI